MITKMSCHKEISVFQADASQMKEMITIRTNYVTKLPILSITFNFQKISAQNSDCKNMISICDNTVLAFIYTLIKYNKICNTTYPHQNDVIQRMKKKTIKSKTKLLVRLIKSTCSSLFCRGARSHKECRSRKPHSKYLNKASSLSDDISTAMRCRGRNPASFSTSI